MEELKVNDFKFSIIDIGESLPIPQMKESGYYDYIMWGDKNDFPDYLIDVYKFKSITHKAIIDRKADMLSFGFEDTLDPEVLAFIENRNSNDNLKTILYKLSLDLLIMGGFAIEVIWSRDGSRIAQIEHLPFETIRVDKKNENKKMKPDYYWVSKNWKNRYKYIPEKIQGFSTLFKEEKRQILYVSKYDAGKTNMTYPLVKWYSSINYILGEWEISQYQLKNIQNGFSAGFSIYFGTGDVPNETKEKAERAFREKMSGSYNAGVNILGWGYGSDQKTIIEPIPTQQNDTKFLELMNTIKATIMTANGITNSELFSYDVSGGVKFSSKDQLREMLEVFQAICIDPDKLLLEGALNKILKVNTSNELKIKKYEI